MKNKAALVLEGFQEISKIEKTKEDYTNRAIQLINRAKKELSIPEDKDIDVRQLVVWLVDRKPELARSTWRQYKSSVLFYLENHEDVQASSEAIEYLKDVTSIGAMKSSTRTSSLKLKKITFEDWQKLDNFLKIKNLKWHQQLRDWLRASILTGLRPVEWKNANFIDHEGKPALKIKNAKNTNGRSHGETRTLILDNISEEDIKTIKSHLTNIRTFSGMGEYEYFYKGCHFALYKACRECWPKRKKHITLYSTRHQFSANAKSSGFSKQEVAAMMGHAVDDTATIHYGRKTAGNEELSVKPIEGEVSKVRSVENKGFNPKKLSNTDILSDLLD